MLDKKSYFIHNNKDQFEYLKKILPYFLFCIIIFILYSYSINYSFLNGWDDQGYVTNNTHIKFSLNNLIYWLKNVLPVGGYTPLVMYSFMLDFYIGGYNPEVYHIQNIVWHIFAVSILFNTFKLFKINTFVAFLLCLLFAIHPQRVESVVWISQRKDVMCAAFYFLTINLYVRNSNLKSKYLSLMTFFAFICALLSKPMAVSLPFILMFYDIYKCKNYNIIKHLKNIWFYFLIIISVSCFTAINFPRAIHRLTVMQDVYVGMYNFYWYIVTFFWPKNLNPFYARVSYDNTYYVLIYFYTLFILLYILLYFNSKKIFLYRILPILLSYFFAFLPICGLFRPAVKDYSDRFSYIPSIFITFGIGLLATKLLAMCKEKNIKIFNFRYLRIYIDKIFLLLFTLVCLFYGIIFFDYNLKIQKYWSSLYSLYKSSILLTTPNLIVLSRLGDMEREGKNYQALLNIGNILNDQFKTDRITEQEKLNIFFAANYFKSYAYYHLKNKSKALKAFYNIEDGVNEKSFKDKNKYINYLRIISELLYRNGESTKATFYLDKIIYSNDISSFGKFYYSGVKNFYLKKYSVALVFFKESLKLEPNNYSVKKNIDLCNKLINKNK